LKSLGFFWAEIAWFLSSFWAQKCLFFVQFLVGAGVA
jgi:hypothetical protein